MSEWTTFAPDGRHHNLNPEDERVVIGTSGRLVLSVKVHEMMGSPERVALLTNSDPTTFGVRAAQPLEYSYGVQTSSNYGREVNAYGILSKLRRRTGSRATLPHSWDGDVLVIDVSGLPERQRGVV